mmetsp:Transcript_1846/g.5891  ORF Transcript_1846/g.5891 Transcript_1846/m.5891 type:complete len:303 (+) Transcript_1846:2240-3148(+)
MPTLTHAYPCSTGALLIAVSALCRARTKSSLLIKPSTENAPCKTVNPRTREPPLPVSSFSMRSINSRSFSDSRAAKCARQAATLSAQSRIPTPVRAFGDAMASTSSSSTGTLGKHSINTFQCLSNNRASSNKMTFSRFGQNACTTTRAQFTRTIAAHVGSTTTRRIAYNTSSTPRSQVLSQSLARNKPSANRFKSFTTLRSRARHTHAFSSVSNVNARMSASIHARISSNITVHDFAFHMSVNLDISASTASSESVTSVEPVTWPASKDVVAVVARTRESTRALNFALITRASSPAADAREA